MRQIRIPQFKHTFMLSLSLKYKTIFYLPTLGILPIKIKSIKVVLLQELYSMADELAPGLWAGDQPRVFVTLGVVPAADSEKHLFVG